MVKIDCMDKPDALLIHIKHSQPIELNEFTSALNAVGGLFVNYVQNNAVSNDMAKAKLYVSKVEEGSIEIFLQEIVPVMVLPFENMNTIFQFAGYIKSFIEGYTKGERAEEKKYTLSELEKLQELFSVTAKDAKGTMEIGAVNMAEKGNIFNSCTFNFHDANSAQNQLKREVQEMKSITSDNIHYRQLMRIYQMRSDMSSDAGNKAIIDAISSDKKGVVFETDELKEQILNSDANPAKKAYLVDVITQTINGKLAAYKVTALHDVIDLD